MPPLTAHTESTYCSQGPELKFWWLTPIEGYDIGVMALPA
jgi:hypothetical protein